MQPIDVSLGEASICGYNAATSLVPFDRALAEVFSAALPLYNVGSQPLLHLKLILLVARQGGSEMLDAGAGTGKGKAAPEGGPWCYSKKRAARNICIIGGEEGNMALELSNY